jgi:hypothetical protein
MADTGAQRSVAVPLVAFAAGAVLAMKVVVSTGIGVLAVFQVVGALWMYGRLGITAPSWLGTVHRVSGIVALLLAAFVAECGVGSPECRWWFLGWTHAHPPHVRLAPGPVVPP